ncbi:MAG: molybdate ABC transporter substrate-binding protein [Gemmatimonadota bacterium]
MKRASTLALLMALAACGGGRPPAKVLTVFAASSLTDAMQGVASGFERDHPGTRVALSFAGSQVLRVQIEQGAPADVYASADPQHLQALAEAGLVVEPTVFAHNALVLVVPETNPAGIESFEQLPRAERVVLGAPEAPVGAYTRVLLERAADELGASFTRSVLDHVVSEESNVRLVLAKVELGEADAAIVYRTDAAAGRRVRWIPLPAALAQRLDYGAGVVRESSHADLASVFVRYLRSPEASALLLDLGFEVD